MREVGPENFLRSPTGHYCVAGPMVVWCASPALAGFAVWGAPSAGDASVIAALAAALEAQEIAPEVDVLVDLRGMPALDPSIVSALVTAAGRLGRRVRRRALLRTPATPVPDTWLDAGFRVAFDLREAVRNLGPDAPPFADAIEAVHAQAQGLGLELGHLRGLLRAKSGDLSIHDAARGLGLPPRTLQRALAVDATSFREEQTAARFSAACELLVTTDDKVSAVAARLGVSERALTLLVRERAGMTPAEYRRAHGPPSRR